ncbi:MAG: ATP-binding protein [Clostridia bacterium]|nr:ATP-binding protein [Clostridia bacterium]
MFYFREEEKAVLKQFVASDMDKAMAVYGRRRTGKTSLIMEYYQSAEKGQCVYYQCTSYHYQTCLKDFIGIVQAFVADSSLLKRAETFREVFLYLTQTGVEGKIFMIDEFPFLAKKNEDAAVEFQWIIDHGLGKNKLILLGSSLSFMKRQIGDREAPLYGRFQRIIELQPFSFQEVHRLFPSFEEAVAVYARTGGVALYVMLYKQYSSVQEGDKALFFQPGGEMLHEAENLLMQELREVSTYVAILRAIGAGEKESSQIAERSGLDQRAVFGYLNKLIDLNIISLVVNPLAAKQKTNRYMISDLLYRFHYTFIEPNISMITTLHGDAMPFILNDQYHEYLGFVYEMIIRGQCFHYGLQGVIPFMPKVIGKWWGNIQENGSWKESEVDVVAFNDKNIVIGECKYRNKQVGVNELTFLQLKSQFMPIKGRKITYLLASKSGFTEELKRLQNQDLVLIDQL